MIRTRWDFTDGPDAVDAERHVFVYDRGGNATSVVLVDGRVAAVWDVPDHHSETRFFPFVNPTYAVEERLWAELAAVGAVITGSAARVTRLDLMAPLTGWVLKPLCTRDEVDQRLMRWISVLALRSPAVSPCGIWAQPQMKGGNYCPATSCSPAAQSVSTQAITVLGHIDAVWP